MVYSSKQSLDEGKLSLPEIVETLDVINKEVFSRTEAFSTSFKEVSKGNFSWSYLVPYDSLLDLFDNCIKSELLGFIFQKFFSFLLNS